MESIETEVIELVRKVASQGEVTRSSTWKDLGFDSLDVTELLMQAEERFAIQIPEAEAEGLKTVGDVIAYVQRRRTA
jgi:acyl carrier protein